MGAGESCRHGPYRGRYKPHHLPNPVAAPAVYLNYEEIRRL